MMLSAWSSHSPAARSIAWATRQQIYQLSLPGISLEFSRVQRGHWLANSDTQRRWFNAAPSSDMGFMSRSSGWLLSWEFWSADIPKEYKSSEIYQNQAEHTPNCRLNQSKQDLWHPSAKSSQGISMYSHLFSTAFPPMSSYVAKSYHELTTYVQLMAVMTHKTPPGSPRLSAHVDVDIAVCQKDDISFHDTASHVLGI